MTRVPNKINTNTSDFWHNYYASVKSEQDRLIIYEQLEQALQSIHFNTVLEIGCGTGIGVAHIKSMFLCHYTGSDFVASAIEKARHNCDDVILLNALVDPVPGFYDVIIIAETLEHLEDPFFVVEKCLPHCKYLVLSLPYDEPEQCDPEHLWYGIKPDDFTEKYNVHFVNVNEHYFQIILTHGNRV